MDNSVEFEWDKGNELKSLLKHGVEPRDSEEIFIDKRIFITHDNLHSYKEDRYRAIGKTKKNVVLFVVYTLRKRKIRIISARYANKKERKMYEKKT